MRLRRPSLMVFWRCLADRGLHLKLAKCEYIPAEPISTHTHRLPPHPPLPTPLAFGTVDFCVRASSDNSHASSRLRLPWSCCASASAARSATTPARWMLLHPADAIRLSPQEDSQKFLSNVCDAHTDTLMSQGPLGRPPFPRAAPTLDWDPFSSGR